MFLFYALVGVICLGVAPLLGKTALKKVSPLTAFALRTVIAALLVIIWVAGTGIHTVLAGLTAEFWVVITAEAVLAAVLGDMAYFYALKRGNINEVSVIMSCAPLITIVVSYFAFNEVVTFNQLTGAVLVTTGLIIISFESPDG